MYVGADGQRPDLEQRLVVSLAASGFVPLHTLNASQRPRSRVWSSKYARRGWRLSDVEDALVDMYVLAEAEAFVASRHTHGIALPTTLCHPRGNLLRLGAPRAKEGCLG